MTREKRWTPGPWEVCAHEDHTTIEAEPWTIAFEVSGVDAHLIAAAPRMVDEMERYLPLLERAEADPAIWENLTEGTGIATANGYRYALAKAYGETEED